MDATVTDLLERSVYGMAQVDRLLALSPGTARRWIDGYTRGGKTYPPVVRLDPTEAEIVTWGEFVETRLLAEYRHAGVPLVRMRPAIDRLRDRFHPRYPLAHARPFIAVAGRELVREVQEEVGLATRLQLVVVRNDQIILSDAASRFVESVDFGPGEDGVVERLHPAPDIREVVVDPLRAFGEPVVRSVPTEIIAEQVRTGESIDGIADLYDLSRPSVEAAVRYELWRATDPKEIAA